MSLYQRSSFGTAVFTLEELCDRFYQQEFDDDRPGTPRKIP